MKRIPLEILITILLATIFCSVPRIPSSKALTGTIYIMADGSINPSTAPVSTVDNITYVLTANIVNDISHGIAVMRDNIVIDGNGFTLSKASTNDVYYAGIGLYQKNNVTIRNTRIERFGCGIFIGSSSNNNISFNMLSNNYKGIYLGYSSDNIISGNFLIGNGIDVDSSYGNSVINNTVNGKPLIYFEEVTDCRVSHAGQVVLIDCRNITVENLNLSRATIGVRFWRTNNSIIIGSHISGNSEEGISLDSSSCQNSIRGNDITNNSIGIDLYSSSNNYMCSNSITNNIYGIGLEQFSTHNWISGNTIGANKEVGILVGSNCDSNNICGNTIANSSSGIYLISSNGRISGNNIASNSVGVLLQGEPLDNVICNNNFVDNTEQIRDLVNLANLWDSGYPLGGNYWSSYVGTDFFSGPYQNETGSDGIGDAPYVIDESNRDNYPLMNPSRPVPGDINEDGIVDIFDIVIVAPAFDSRPADPNWNLVSDINNDNIVDIFDIVAVAVHFSEMRW